MAFSYTIENDVILIRGTGEVTDEEIIETATNIFADPRLTDTMPVLTDLSAVTPSEVTKNMMDRLLAQRRTDSNRRRNAKHAICAPNDVGFGMSRAFASFGEADVGDVKIRVFRNIEDAKAWLGIE